MADGDRWLFSGLDERFEYAKAFESSTGAGTPQEPCTPCVSGARLDAFARRWPTEAIVCRHCKRERQGARYSEYAAAQDRQELRDAIARDGLDILYSLGAP